ncbi:DNA cytosine methyltransferase [Streptosporangium amethystogenes subsp. fukuiense]|uniref:Cytosine-specific methyltransferase n=1 Tax=Streptosporangium amethystogenes subsp. fukuiense TaxID=698418 RepID=A0ABW2TBA5_9ACTN
MTARDASPINVIDLFAGCGGFTEGFRSFRPDAETSSPYRSVAAVEFDLAAASTYAANFGKWAGGADHVFPGDIKDWDPGSVGHDVDVILGGPPCQGFSGLGKEDVDDPRNKLWRQYMRVVKAVKPKVFIIENVERFFRSMEYEALYAATEKPDGELREYRLESATLNSADYGVPQSRRRAIVMASHRDLPPLRHPTPTHKRRQNGVDSIPGVDDLPDWVAVAAVFKKTSEATATTELPARDCIQLDDHRLPGAFRSRELHIGREPTQTSLKRYRAIPPGGNRHDLPPDLSTPNWIKHRTGSGDVMGRLVWDKPSVTIRTEFFKPEKGRYLHPFADRPLTHYEAALIQDFPDDFLWCGSKTQIARQIGNAVPVGLAKAIAGQVYRHSREW